MYLFFNVTKFTVLNPADRDALNQNGNDNDIFLRHMIKRFDFIF